MRGLDGLVVFDDSSVEVEDGYNKAKMSPMEKLMRIWRRTFMMLSSRDIFRIHSHEPVVMGDGMVVIIRIVI